MFPGGHNIVTLPMDKYPTRRIPPFPKQKERYWVINDDKQARGWNRAKSHKNDA
jgi:hypothetical protein